MDLFDKIEIVYLILNKYILYKNNLIKLPHIDMVRFFVQNLIE